MVDGRELLDVFVRQPAAVEVRVEAPFDKVIPPTSVELLLSRRINRRHWLLVAPSKYRLNVVLIVKTHGALEVYVKGV